jgi:hypothetical protein
MCLFANSRVSLHEQSRVSSSTKRGYKSLTTFSLRHTAMPPKEKPQRRKTKRSALAAKTMRSTSRGERLELATKIFNELNQYCPRTTKIVLNYVEKLLQAIVENRQDFSLEKALLKLSRTKPPRPSVRTPALTPEEHNAYVLSIIAPNIKKNVEKMATVSSKTKLSSSPSQAWTTYSTPTEAPSTPINDVQIELFSSPRALVVDSFPMDLSFLLS